MGSGKIKKLSEKVCNQISAGEVIERPASVIKELVENSIDAGADTINVGIEKGGRKLIKVKDNGIGFPAAEIEKAFSRYTTSKINAIDDIYSLQTLGFRGEALASIAAVSSITVKSRHKNENKGVILKLKAGEIIEKKTAGFPQGAEIIVEDLFFNTPARFKHMKKASTEAVQVNKNLTAAALANPEISFKLHHNGNKSMSTPGNNNLKSTIFSLYGEKVHDNLIPVKFSREYLKVTGFIVNPNLSRSSRRHEFFFVNKRPVRNKYLRNGIEEAYSSFLHKNRYPLIFLNLQINPILVDVNVHPSKKRVKLSRGEEIREILSEEVTKILSDFDSSQKVENLHSLKHEEYESINENYDQNTKSNNSAKTTSENTAFDFHSEDNKSDKYYLSDFKLPNKVKDNNSKGIDKKNFKQEHDLARGVIGQLHNLFILYQSQEGLYIIDQHNAHERVIYEEIKEQVLSENIESRMLLTPKNLELTPEEREKIKYLKEDLTEFGFSLEKFGPSSYALTAVPVFLQNIKEKSPEDLIFLLLENSKKLEKDTLQKEILKYSSCKKAVKEGQKLNKKEMESICRKLFSTSNPYLCPHKRPIIVNISLQDLKKKVERPEEG